MKTFDGNIRSIDGLDDDELYAALKGGWHPELPAIKDENGVVIIGHRRLRIAAEHDIEPVIKVVTFGEGAEADAERTRLANVSNIGAAPMTIADRRRQVERLYKEKLSQEAMANMLGVSQGTISNDLATLLTINNVADRGKDTLGRKKSTGRPNKRAPTERDKKLEARNDKIIALADKGVPTKEISKEVGLVDRGVSQVIEHERIRREAVPDIDPATLSMSAQEKLATALSQHQRKLDAQFEVRVLDEIKKRMDEIVLPHWRKQIAEAQKLYERRKGAMDKSTFNKIRRGLHPDSRQSISDKVLAEAFDTFMSLEKYLLSEKDSQTLWPDIPKSAAEWDKMRTKPRKHNNANSVRVR